jgi:hypothetical protein
MVAAAIFSRRFGSEDSGGLELAQAVGQNVGRNALAGVLKLAECAVTAHHHVADDEQRLAVAQEFKRDADRASGAVFRGGFAGHEKTLHIFACDLESKCF